MFSHPEKYYMSVCKHHFERPYHIGFDLAELFSMQETISVYIGVGLLGEEENDIQTSALLNYSCSEFFSETDA